MTLKEYIENYLKQNNLTIREFARKCHLSHPVILNILNNPEYRPEILTLEKISEYTGHKLVLLLKMAYPAAFEEDGEPNAIDELLAQAFNDAPEEVQQAVLKLFGLK